MSSHQLNVMAYAGDTPQDGGTSGPDNDVILVDMESTVKYITGEMSFAEFNAILEQHIKEEPPDDYENTVPTSIEEYAEEVEVNSEPAQVSAELPSVSSVEGFVDAAEKKMRAYRSKLPKDMQGLMGEANMKFAHGQSDEAIKMCMEVIRQVPNAIEPFQSLSLIYEDKGDSEKCLQFALIAAHLKQRDHEEWIKVAELYLEQNNTEQAIKCYTKAIRWDPAKSLSLWWTVCNLYQELGDRKHAMSGYEHILKQLAKRNGQEYFQLARDVTKAYHTDGEHENALRAMAMAFSLHPRYVNVEDVNLLIELYINQRVYDKPLEALVQHCGVCLVYADNSILVCHDGLETVKLPPNLKPTQCKTPDVMPVDLRSKLIVCMIHLSYVDALLDVSKVLFSENVEEVGDLFLDVAEAHMDVGDYKNAKVALGSLVKSDNYNLAAVWLKYAECLNSLAEQQGAVHAYKKVVELAPSHLGARVSLSALQQQLGRHEEALEALQHEPDDVEPKIDVRLLLPKSMLLYSQEKYSEFIDCSKKVIFSHFKDVFRRQHLAIILSNRSMKHRVQALRHVMGTKFETQIKSASELLSESSVTIDDLWELYLKLCHVLIVEKRFEELENVSICSLMLPQFMQNAQKALEADFVCLVACILNKNGHFAYNFIREICVKDLHNERAWNLFSQIVTMSQDFRHNRYCLRMLMKHPDHHALSILNAHNAMVAGTYKHALGEYVTAFRQDPDDPMLSLCIGVTFIHMASQKFASKRHSLTIQGCAFLNQYLEMRGECQETWYNVGRALHQLGLTHASILYYEKALECAPSCEDKDIFDLSKEIAFNLCLIYRSSGSVDLASMITSKYLVM